MNYPPWFKEPPSWSSGSGAGRGDGLRNRLIQLHREIVEFNARLSPTQEEQQKRTAAVLRVAEAARSLWPDSEVKVFGSFATGLYLPTSDIDVVILNSGRGTVQSRLRALEAELKAARIGRKIEVIGKAKVPIMKFLERESGIAFDVSLDTRRELDSVDMIKEAVREAPWIALLYRVLKIFLQQKHLNEVYHTGGLNSYTVFVMLRFFLQIHPHSTQLCLSDEHLGPSDQQLGHLGLSNQQFCLSDQHLGCSDQQLGFSVQNMQDHNLGVLLLGFFHLYGYSLNVREYGISCSNGGHLFRKSELGFMDSWKPYLLAAQDPLSRTNDVGRSSFNFPHIQATFRNAYDQLNRNLNDGSPLLACIL